MYWALQQALGHIGEQDKLPLHEGVNGHYVHGYIDLEDVVTALLNTFVTNHATCFFINKLLLYTCLSFYQKQSEQFRLFSGCLDYKIKGFVAFDTFQCIRHGKGSFANDVSLILCKVGHLFRNESLLLEVNIR